VGIAEARVVDHTRGVAAIRQGADDFAARIAPMIQEPRQAGATLAQIAARLTADGIKTARGGALPSSKLRNRFFQAAASSTS
jgi:hypothetical protein